MDSLFEAVFDSSNEEQCARVFERILQQTYKERESLGLGLKNAIFMWVTGTQASSAAILTPLTDAITAAALLSASVQHAPIPTALAQGAVNPGRSTIAFLTSSTDDLVAAVPSGPIQGVGHDEDPGSVIDAVGQTNVEPGDMVDEDPDEDMVDEDPYMQNVPLVIPNAAADGPRKRGARPGVEIPLLHFL
jgi:hypothetical protein